MLLAYLGEGIEYYQEMGWVTISPLLLLLLPQLSTIFLFDSSFVSIELADTLGIDKFSIIGWNSGANYALGTLPVTISPPHMMIP